MRTSIFFLAIFCASGSLPAADVQLSDVDVAGSALFRNTKSQPATADVLAKILDPKGNENTTWRISTTQAENESQAVFHSRIAFKHPVSMGGLTATLHNPGSVSIRALKPDAPFPGDPAVETHWLTFSIRRAHDTFDCVFPPAFQTRAILISESRTSHQSSLASCVFRSERRTDLTGAAIAQGEHAKFGDDPMNLIAGRSWKNAGANPENGQINRSPISTVYPSWANLAWKEPQSVSSVRIRSNAETFELREFIGGADENPALASPKAWRAISVEARKRSLDRGDWFEHTFTFDSPKMIRALQFQVTKVSNAARSSAILELQSFSVFRELAVDEPAPAPAVKAQDLPPLQFSYKIDVDSEPAMVINTPDGRRVRNLFAQVPRAAGEHTATWDLKDENGLPVAPGTYHWEAIYGPEPRLIYQQTPYPNNYAHSPQSAPWPGEPSDGWLSNHGNIAAICAVGDHVFIGQTGSEGGHALIEVTNTGSKLWGTHETAQKLFTNGATLFRYSAWEKSVSRLNRETGRLELLFKTADNPERQGSLVGLAAKDGKIAVAFHAPVPYLENATSATKVAIEHCLPKLREEVKGSANRGISGRPQWDFMSHFRLTEFVNGSEENGGLLRITSTKGAGRQQHVLLAFKEPVALGSLIFPRFSAPADVQMQAYALKPTAPFPPRLDKAEDWTPIPLGEIGLWNCVPLPENTQTRALRLTFAQPGNALDSLLDGDTPGEPKLDFNAPAEGAKTKSVRVDRKEWSAELDGMRLLRRRFESVSQKATIHVSSGTYDEKTGEWDARRATVLSESDPATFTMQWAQPQSIRGLSIKELDGEEALIDVFTGGAEATIDPASDSQWRQVATYRQEQRFLYFPDRRNNSRALYLDGVVDFGRSFETRAVRVRVVSQWKEQTGRLWGVRLDRGGSQVDFKRCRLYGIAALRYLGGEPEKSAIGVQRLEVRDAATGKLLDEKLSNVTSDICFAPDGQLYGIVGESVVRLADGTSVVTALENPRCLRISTGGEFYVYVHGDQNRQVRVFDSSGTMLRTIGKAGRRVAGPWDPEFLEDISEMTLDSDGNLWLVYKHDNPRRVIKFSAAGKFLAEFLGNTNYGGGGTVDPWDPTRMYYRDMVFKLNPQTGESRLAALMAADHMESSDYSDRRIRWLTEPIMLNGRRYIVTAPFSHTPEQTVGVVHLFDEKSMTVRMCGAIGHASTFPPLQNARFIAKTGGNPLGSYRFLWNDLNQNGVVDLDEVQFTKLEFTNFRVGRFDEGLGIMADNLRFEPERFLSDGTPVLKESKLSFAADYKLANGNFFRYGKGANEVVSPKGELIWSYPAQQGMNGLYVPPYVPGVVDVQFGMKGHGRTSAQGLGDFFVIFANNGQTNVWTADGLLATRITRHINDPLRKTFPSMDHKQGTDMTGVTWGQEHFFNHFAQSATDGRHYVVGGHLTVSLFEVKGLKDFKRMRGKIEVTPELVEQTRRWDADRIERDQYAKPRIARSLPGTAEPDGQIGNTEYKSEPVEIEDLAELSVSHDDNALHLGWRVRSSAGPLKNTGTEFQRAFKTGGGVDIKLGLDASADPNRRQPVAGDIRIVLTLFNDKPTAIIYRPVAPGKSAPWETTTAAGGTTAFDEVAIASDIKIVHKGEGQGYVLEAAVPWQTLGLKKAPIGRRLRFDWSVLSTDKGNQTVARQSWANTLAVGVTDEPTEARLVPGLWGWLEIQARDSGAPDIDGPLRKKPKDDLDSILDGL